MLGRQIKDYRIEEMIGEGGMGTVYRATDLVLHRSVAIKIIHPHLLRDPAATQRFQKEAVIQAKLAHPNIVAVYAFDADEGAIIMEYVPGHSLNEVISKITGPLPVSLCVDIMSQVLRAVSYAHSQGIIHRDLKPSNIMIVQPGAQIIAKVTDFGIAKIVGDLSKITATGTNLGTLAYMPPEQLLSPKNIGPLSDIYALGVTLYEMTTGRVPFEADSALSLMEKIVAEIPPPPHKVNALVPEAFGRIILTALAKEPRARYQSCEEFAEALLSLPVSAKRNELKAGVSPLFPRVGISPFSPLGGGVQSASPVPPPVPSPPHPAEKESAAFDKTEIESPLPLPSCGMMSGQTEIAADWPPSPKKLSRRRPLIIALLAFFASILVGLVGLYFIVIQPKIKSEARTSLEKIYTAQDEYYIAHKYYACELGRLAGVPTETPYYDYHITKCGQVFIVKAVGKKGSLAAGEVWEMDESHTLRKLDRASSSVPARPLCVGNCGEETQEEAVRAIPPEQVVREFLEAVNRKDVEAACALKVQCSEGDKTWIRDGGRITLLDLRVNPREKERALVSTSLREEKREGGEMELLHEWELVWADGRWKIKSQNVVRWEAKSTPPPLMAPALSPAEVINALFEAERRRDAYEAAKYYAPEIQYFSRRKNRTNAELLASKLKSYRKYNLHYELQESNIAVKYNYDHTAAVVEFDFYTRCEGTTVKPFFCNVRKRMRMRTYQSQWKIDCEEDILIRWASNPAAVGTDICRLD